jgi:hypothetical protein
MQRPYAAVFIHGLAKKPAPDKLREIWLWGITRDNPNPSVFAAPNRGINLGSQGVAALFNYYADVFYGTDYETELQSYYEADDELEVLSGEHLDRIEPGLKLPNAVTPRERAFVRNFEEKLGASAALATPPALVATTSEAAEPSNDASDLEIASWLPMNIKQAVIKKAAMEAFYFLFDKEYERPDGTRFKVRQELRKRLLDDLTKAFRLTTAIEIEPGVTRRVWCYEFPSLDDCRAAFDELLGQPVDWPALSPGEGGRALKSSPDDSVPV